MIGRYEDLDKVFQENEVSRIKARSDSSLAELKSWHDAQPKKSYLGHLLSSDIQSFPLPQAGKRTYKVFIGAKCEDIFTEISYRQSVLRQQERAKEISAWHKTTLPVGIQSQYATKFP
jgi:hypothetical protein